MAATVGQAAVQASAVPERRLLAVGREMCALVSSDAAYWTDAGFVPSLVHTGLDALHALLGHDYALVLVSSTLPDLSPPVFVEQVAAFAPGVAMVAAAPSAGVRPAIAGGCLESLALPYTALDMRLAAQRGLTAARPLQIPPPDLYHLLGRLQNAVAAAGTPVETLGLIADELLALSDGVAAAIYLLRSPDPCFVAASRGPLDAAHTRRLTVELEQAYLHLTGAPSVLAPLQHHAAAQGAPPPPLGEVLRIPLLLDHQVKGILCAAWTVERTPAPGAARLLFHVANHAVAFHQEVWRARHMATRDHLTGLYNRGMFNETLKQAFSLAQRKGASLGLLLFDFDNLKSVNDEYGHLAGDQVLREAAGLALATVRASDMVARFGGDEFAVILPDTDMVDARRVGERLVSAFRDRQFAVPGSRQPVTISAGVAAMRPSRELTCHLLLAQADAALLSAKRGGKDRCCTAEAGESPAPSPAPLPTPAARRRALILDDEPSVRDILGRMLGMMGYDTVTSGTIEDALRAIETESEFDIVLTDLHLGEGTGIDMLQALKQKAPLTVKLVVSGYASKETAIECLRHGAFDFVEKPFAFSQLTAAMERAMDHRRLLVSNHRYQVQLEELVRARSESLSHALDSLRRSYAQTIQTLALMIDAREANTGVHCRAAREAVGTLARRMDISHHDIETLEMGAVLHDIGKLAIPDAILQKPGPLTPEERQVMQKHAQIGFDLLAGVPFLHDAAQIVLHHHESYDGSGYPAGLTGDQICLGARIFAVIDAYHAMRFERCYRPMLTADVACGEIVRCSGHQFDPAVVAAFLECQSEIEASFASVRAAKAAAS